MIVVDNSVAVSWFLADELDPYAVTVLKALGETQEMLVPPLWFLEFVNMMLVAERRGRIQSDIRLDAMERLKSLPMRVAPSPTVFSVEVLHTLAHRHSLSAYDAEYLRIAKEMRLPLATLDRSLRDAAVRESIALFET